MHGVGFGAYRNGFRMRVRALQCLGCVDHSFEGCWEGIFVKGQGLDLYWQAAYVVNILSK